MKTETEQKATPRPWEVISGNDNAIHIVHGPGEVATVFKWDSCNGATPESQSLEAEANAAFIVKAVNAYDADQEIIERIKFQQGAILGALIASGHSGAEAFFRETIAKAEARHA